MPVSLKDIREAFEFVCAGGGGEHQAFLCKQSGKLYCHSDLCDDLDILPNDIDDTEKFLQIPDKKELDLGKPLALDFRPPIPARRLRRRSTIFQQKGRLRQILRICWVEGACSISGTISRRKPRKEHLRMWCDLNSIEARRIAAASLPKPFSTGA